MIALVALTLTLAQNTPAPPPQEQRADVVEQMNKARATFDYGDYAQAEKQLSALVEVGRFESEALAAEAWRLLGLSRFYLNRKPEAVNAFLEMLYIDPDAELDPFYAPPAAVAFFEQVKKDHEPQIKPVRERKRGEAEARRKAAAEESERRRQAQLEEERQRLASLAQPSIERRVVQKEFWVSLLPFGLGQLQNGDKSLGYTLATSEVIVGAMSAGSALLIEQLRDPVTGKFESKNSVNYAIARDLNAVKWVSAGLFYALWAAGAVHAAVRFQPEQQLPDRLLQKP